MSLKNVSSQESTLTKMTAEITQSGAAFRGIDRMYVVPFQTAGEEVEAGTLRLGERNIALGGTGISRSGLVENNNSHLFGSATVPDGLDRVLTYGKAPDGGENATKDSKHHYGVLTPEGLDNPSASDDISFHLEKVLSDGEADELTEMQDTADDLLELLNVVMSLMGNSAYASVVKIYDDVKRENQILSCSYSSFDQLRNEIQTALLRIPYESMELIGEIGRVSQAISAFSTALTEVGSTFPASYGIPEGALGFWWNGKEFVRMINGVNIALVDPESYCYPPSLWYYANSSVKTSVDENVRKEYVATNLTWDDILTHYTDGDTVTPFTQALAIADPLQYGVGLMSLSLGTPGEEVSTLISGCPLTGIIIGDQKDVDFRFLPGQGLSRFIYDSEMNEMLLIGSTGRFTHTLVLESPPGTPVHFALEFRNNSGYTRHCQQGDILPRCKFYIAGILEAPEGGGSVFSRDHRTSVTAKITSLRNAYTTVPDLHSPQLEIGVVAEMKWNQITPQSLTLNY